MVALVNSVQKPQESTMSQSMETFLRQNGAGIDITTWNQLVASLPRRARRSVELRLASANRTLSSLRLSERSERRMLQMAREKLEVSRQVDGKGRRPTVAAAELALEVETHLSNLKTIEQQIALVRLAIEHLHRRTVGWSSRHEKQADRPARKSDEEVDRANQHLQRGFAAVRAIRAARAAKHSASMNV
jgi:hypothetical protein